MKELHYRNSSKVVSQEFDPQIIDRKSSSISNSFFLDDKIFSQIQFITPENKKNCITCMGRSLACGKLQCPILRQAMQFKTIEKEINSKEIFGSSPPSVFIGRLGYPNLNVGPLVPPIIGDTSIMDETEQWFNLELNNIIDMRMNLIRGKSIINAKSANQINLENQSNRYLSVIQEIALADKSVEIEAKFKKIPQKRIILDADLQPMGPSAPLNKVTVTSNSTNQRIQKCFDDTDRLATDTVIYLKKSNESQTSITRAFSSGIFGLGKKRKLVPTRWAITAVDSMLGIHYWKNIINFPFITDFRVFEVTYLANKFLILMFPESWGYELIEAFFPGSAWNPGDNISMANDFEGLKGRKDYARIGGCYYAARNIIGEYLNSIRRQARVVILRESYPEFIMPLGVWFTRQCIKNALTYPYVSFDSKFELLNYVSSRMKIPINYWFKISGILHNDKKIKQKSLYKYIKRAI
ncbi:MAG: hypothetical protein ACFFD1_10130 [Candidatus Thorarchaeota archaeon]